MSEEEFLMCTPRKLFKLAEIHQKVNSPQEEKKGGNNNSSQSEEQYIDNILL